MTIEEMKARKAELGYTNETVAALSGVPLGTVQKIFAGETKAPRYDTIQKLTKVLQKPLRAYGVYEEITGTVTSAAAETGALNAYLPQSRMPGESPMLAGAYMKPPKKKLGIADGKFKMPPDEMFFDDEISEMFDDI